MMKVAKQKFVNLLILTLVSIILFNSDLLRVLISKLVIKHSIKDVDADLINLPNTSKESNYIDSSDRTLESRSKPAHRTREVVVPLKPFSNMPSTSNPTNYSLRSPSPICTLSFTLPPLEPVRQCASNGSLLDTSFRVTPRLHHVLLDLRRHVSAHFHAAIASVLGEQFI